MVQLSQLLWLEFEERDVQVFGRKMIFKTGVGCRWRHKRREGHNFSISLSLSLSSTHTLFPLNTHSSAHTYPLRLRDFSHTFSEKISLSVPFSEFLFTNSLFLSFFLYFSISVSLLLFLSLYVPQLLSFFGSRTVHLSLSLHHLSLEQLINFLSINKLFSLSLFYWHTWTNNCSKHTVFGYLVNYCSSTYLFFFSVST